MQSFRTRRPLTLAIAFLLIVPIVGHSVMAVAPGNDSFLRTWERTDQPVASGQASRTWMWGPEAFTDLLDEEYTESPGEIRTVQYFDKSRMEITNPGADQNSIWYVTNGLLVVELLTGQMQVGNNDFVPRFPAEVNVAGDSDDETGPTYATFSFLLGHDALTEGTVITQRINRAGEVTDDPALAGKDVLAARYVAETDHTVAAPFWEFMNSTGPVYEDGSIVNAALFQNSFYATGFPVAEAYWAEVKVAGTYRDVLMQCFERRCLTYTPDNPAGWQVEAGNVGQHYYTWRYETQEPPPVEEPEPTYPIAYIEWINDGTISNRWINVMNSDGSGSQIVELEDTVGLLTAISLSPDGQTIAFLGTDQTGPGERHLFTVNVDGSEYKKLTHHPNDRWPVLVSWSPDGTQIAMVVLEPKDGVVYPYIYIISKDGTAMQQVTGGLEVIWAVTWSPDGSSLLFSSNSDCDAGFVSCIWEIRIGETEWTKVLTTQADNIIDIDWSPDGSEIVYGTWHGSDEFEIRIAAADGSNDHHLLDSQSVMHPRWSPTGERVYFSDNHSGLRNIYVVDRDGSNVRQLTDGPNDEYMPSPPSR